MAEVIDYEDSDYPQRFWQDVDRVYEHEAEQIALGQLLPPQGKRLVDIGAGFGRHAQAGLYDGYEEVILLDYSVSMLELARRSLGRDGRFLYVAGNIYSLPLASGCCDTLVIVRVMHHLEDVPRALCELHRVLVSGGVLVLEYANKRHLKSMGRYALKRQAWSPFEPRPYEFVRLNFDFHPRWMAQCLQEAQFAVGRELAVSHFRVPFLKRLVGGQRLARWESPLMSWGARLKLAPSVFVRAYPVGNGGVKVTEHIFRCPFCGNEDLYQIEGAMKCLHCGNIWAQRDGIYDFKQPI